MQLESLLSETYFGSTIAEYLLFSTAVMAGAVLGKTLNFMYERRLMKKAEATETNLDDVVLYAIGKPVVLLGVIFGVAIGRNAFSSLEEPLASIVAVSVEIPVIITLAWVGIRLTDGVVDEYLMVYAEETETKLDDQIIPIANRIANIALAAIAGIVVLDSIGYNVTAIIASLGIGGIAIAFAAKQTLSDLFGGIHILTTKPFLVGDRIEFQGTVGDVEDIGLRTTRVRDKQGRLNTFPNSAMVNNKVRNISSEGTRRVDSYVRLTYDTDAAEMERAVDIANDGLRDRGDVKTEDSAAYFWDYGDMALKIRLTYYIEDIGRRKEIRSEVNLTLQKAFEEAGLELAVPIKPIRLNRAGGQQPAASTRG
jgi:MscS family membrane protein